MSADGRRTTLNSSLRLGECQDHDCSSVSYQSGGWHERETPKLIFQYIHRDDIIDYSRFKTIPSKFKHIRKHCSRNTTQKSSGSQMNKYGSNLLLRHACLLRVNLRCRHLNITPNRRIASTCILLCHDKTLTVITEIQSALTLSSLGPCLGG